MPRPLSFARALFVPLFFFHVTKSPASTLPSLLKSPSRPIGVAFTFIAWLYAAAFVLLTASIVGEAIATDKGWFGRWLMKPRPVAVTREVDEVAEETAVAVDESERVVEDEAPLDEGGSPPDPASGVSAGRTP